MNVEGYSVNRGDIVAEVMGTGTLEARVEAVISPKISGLLTNVLVDQGDTVKAGQVLARLDDSDLKQQVAIAQSNLDAATAVLKRVQADVNRARAVLDQAQRDNVRNQKLFLNKTISDSQVEKSTETLKVAEADMARAAAASIETDKQLIVAKNTLGYHRARLTDTVITAPFDGLIVRRDREPGDVIVPGSSIYSLISTEEMWIKAWVDETEMGKITPDQKARVRFRSEPDHSYQGTVVRLGRESDRETREFIVDVRVNRLPPQWAVGQRAEVYIETARKSHVLAVPSGMILRDKSQPGVFVARSGRAAWRPVKIGLQGRDKAEIIEGINPDELVIMPADTGRTKGLTDGQRVRVTQP